MMIGTANMPQYDKNQHPLTSPLPLPTRSPALTPPRNSLASPFGPSLFSSNSANWPIGTPPSTTFLSANVSMDDSEEDIEGAARTLHYLDLDEQSPPSPPNPYPEKFFYNDQPSEPAINFSITQSPVIYPTFSPSYPGYCPASMPSSTPSNLDYDQARSPNRVKPRSKSLVDNMLMRSEYTGNSRSFEPSSAPIFSNPENLKLDEISFLNDANEFQGQPDSPVPSKSLWIGNIDASLTSAELFNIFGVYGNIDSLRILPERECAFVNYSRVDDAVTACKEMQGGRVGDCIIRVGFAKVTENVNNTKTSNNTNESSNGELQEPSKSLWVGNIPPSTDPTELESFFSPFGLVESARVLTHKNCGFVNFVLIDDAIKAKKAMNGKEVNGSIIKIGFAKVPGKLEITSVNHIINQTNVISPGSLLQKSKAMAAANHKRNSTTSPLNYTSNLNAPSYTAASSPSPSVISNGLVTPPRTTFSSSYGSSSVTYPLQSYNNSATLDRTPTIPFTPQPSNRAAYAVSASAPRVLIANAEPTSSQVLLEELNKLPPTTSGDYCKVIPPLPEPKVNRKVDQSRLREMRKKLENQPSMKDVELIFKECLDELIELSTDYIGNVVVQRLIDRGTDSQKLLIIEKLSTHMAAIGIHKNGTWVVQKIMDSVKTSAQVHAIINSINQYVPPLMLDQFGNYVVQCCLRLGSHRNQFIFEAIHACCWEIGQGRFGARAVRACLESQHTSKQQQGYAAMAIIEEAEQLCVNPNGAILITWLLDSSCLAGRYSALAPKLFENIADFCVHKIASSTILKLVNQRVELDAREIIMQAIFSNSSTLSVILTDQIYGVSVVQKILSNACLSMNEKSKISQRVKIVLSKMPNCKPGHLGYKRLLEELSATSDVVDNSCLPYYGALAAQSFSTLPKQQPNQPDYNVEYDNMARRRFAKE